MKHLKKYTILKGGGVNQHTLYGDFKINTDKKEFNEIDILLNSMLVHEQPNGNFAEHNSLKVSTGQWVMGKQVEYNPFNQIITRVWD